MVGGDAKPRDCHVKPHVYTRANFGYPTSSYYMGEIFIACPHDPKHKPFTKRKYIKRYLQTFRPMLETYINV
jgi:hypothetical protein